MIKVEQGKALAPVIAGTTVALYLSYKIFLSLLHKKNKYAKKIPVPGSSYPYVGHMSSLGDMPAETISQWHKELGPIIQFRMGVQTWVSIDSPELAHKVMVTNGSKASHRNENEFSYKLSSFGGKGIVNSQPNPAWKKARAAVTAAIAPSQIELHMASIQKQAKKLVDTLIETSKKTKAGSFPFKDLQLYVMNTVTLIAFGRTFPTRDDPKFIEISETIDEGFKLSGVDYDLANYLPIFAIYDYFKGVRSILKRFLKERRDPLFRGLIDDAYHTDGPNLVKYLKENGYDLSEEETMVIFSDLISAGTDTNSLYLCWTIAIMCRHPEVQLKIAAEIDDFVKRNGRLPLFSERLELPFCISAMKECMRYKPITAFGIPHLAIDDIEVDGYIIPKGATIISNMISMHQNSEFYTDRPNEYVPERFLEKLETSSASSKGKVEDRDHFNFGWGRRICPAIHMAEVETFIGFVELMSRCFIEPGEDGMPNIDIAENGGVSILPSPYKVKFTDRSLIDPTQN
ncbi:cytochrome P450 [Mucor mucedo]|uniref:cytochrome P450 n=1 Tax=Mucor mucedo TaxID=29922 RepID=UPI00222110FC|nr:cytochrome P450 [Mucor mucedo]KAI7896201.1 cytochrome P450 [Mucor mucedo]